MDAGKNYGACAVCDGTISLHINVARPMNHKFTPKHSDAKPESHEISVVTEYAYFETCDHGLSVCQQIMDWLDADEVK